MIFNTLQKHMSECLTKCHVCHAKRSNDTSETSKNDHLCKTSHRHGHTEFVRTVANGCGRLRTVANGCERLRTRTQRRANTLSTPRPPGPQSETGTLATHSGTKQTSTIYNYYITKTDPIARGIPNFIHLSHLSGGLWHWLSLAPRNPPSFVQHVAEFPIIFMVNPAVNRPPCFFISSIAVNHDYSCFILLHPQLFHRCANHLKFLIMSNQSQLNQFSHIIFHP